MFDSPQLLLNFIFIILTKTIKNKNKERFLNVKRQELNDMSKKDYMKESKPIGLGHFKSVVVSLEHFISFIQFTRNEKYILSSS